VTFDFDDAVVVITGGARGIGAGIGARFAAAGARVVVWDLDPTAVDGWEPALALRVDVTDAASVAAAAEETLALAGRIDVLVACAGITGPVAPVWDYDPEAWRRVLEIDLTGTFLAARAVAPAMRAQQWGRIVFVASIAGKEGNPELAAYSAAKHGVVGLTKSLARELIHDGVTVNAVTPVMVQTDLFAQLTPAFIERTRALIPMGRFLQIDEVASTVMWISSDACSFTTGTAFDLSGGRADY